MKRRVYRSLDNPSSLLGIKGIFLVGLLVCLAVVGFFSLLIGAASSSIVGRLFFIVGLVGSYLAVIVIQGNFTEKELRRWFSSKRLPQFIQVRPIKFRGLWIHQ